MAADESFSFIDDDSEDPDFQDETGELSGDDQYTPDSEEEEDEGIYSGEVEEESSDSEWNTWAGGNKKRKKPPAKIQAPPNKKQKKQTTSTSTRRRQRNPLTIASNVPSPSRYVPQWISKKSKTGADTNNTIRSIKNSTRRTTNGRSNSTKSRKKLRISDYFLSQQFAENEPDDNEDESYVEESKDEEDEDEEDEDGTERAKATGKKVFDFFSYRGDGVAGGIGKDSKIRKPLPAKNHRKEEILVEDEDEEEILRDVLNTKEGDVGMSNVEEEERREEESKRKRSRAPRKTKVVVIASDEEDEEEGEENKENKEIDLADEDEEPEDDNKMETSAEDEEEEEEEEGEEIDRILSKCEKISQRIQSVVRHLSSVNGTTLASQSTLGEEEEDGNVVQPPSLLEMKLTWYQVIGLNWLYLLHREQLSGILADEMGLGKTIQTIALLALLYSLAREGKTKTKLAPVLIIVPSTVLANWGRELDRWCPTLKYELYYGTMKERRILQRRILEIWKQSEESEENDEEGEERVDIVITTYNIAFSKYDRGFLKSTEWEYLILDEAQQIKNAASLRHQKLFGLKSKYRLLLTGTPLQNNLEELFALLYFVLPSLFGTPSQFKLLLSQLRKSKKGSKQGDDQWKTNKYVERAKAILGPFMLRRLKSEVRFELPEKKEEIVYCEMPKLQAKLYASLIRRSKQMMATVVTVDDDDDADEKKSKKRKKKQKQNKGKNSRIKDVELRNMLMEMRKVANHPLLTRTLYGDAKVMEIAKAAKKDKSGANKDIKGETVDDVASYLCAQSDFSIHCMVENYPKLARYRLSDDQIFHSSAKLCELEKLLAELHGKDSSSLHRVLLFSQMTKVLDFLEPFLTRLGYLYVRLDGGTPVDERQGIIDQFTEDKNYFVFLLSTRAGGLGINLTAADTVIFFDISFNPQVERQAEDRVHRLGQTKEVRVIKLVTKSTIDEHIMKMALQKSELSAVLLGEEGEEKEEGTHKEIERLLSNVIQDRG